MFVRLMMAHGIRFRKLAAAQLADTEKYRAHIVGGTTMDARYSPVATFRAGG
jgi:hypothetical protein